MKRIALTTLLLTLLSTNLTGCAAPDSHFQNQQKWANKSDHLPTYEDIPKNEYLFWDDHAYTPPTIAELFLLTEQQQEEFLNFYYAEELQQLAPDKRFALFIEQRYGDFNYFGKTLKAAETLQDEQGNCMSLAVLSTAYANLVDVTISYQMVYSAPVYELVNDILYISSHVRSRISSPTYVDRVTETYKFSHSYIDYFPTTGRLRGQHISESHFISMFYQNVAAELLKQDADQTALSYIKKALEIAPDNVTALNTLAVLHRRQQDHTTAEKLYHFILDNYPANLSVVVNFREMLRLQGRHDEAEALNETIAQIDDPNPYEWISLAAEAIQNNKLSRAEHYLQKAEQLAPYLDEIYFQHARIDYLRGRTLSAERHLVMAQQHARSAERRHLYQAKLGVLDENH